MGLSTELISQFVKTTKDEPQAKTEKTVYGTVKIDGINKYVCLDGSTVLTPIQHTAAVKDGDRVTVMIKNHHAVVTGNLTDKAASGDNVDGMGQSISAAQGEIKNLTAETAKIENLIADNVDIKGRLDVNEGNIETLLTNKVTVAGRLDAVEADIEDLNARYGQFDNLEAVVADIGTLKAEDIAIKGRLDAAEATIKNITSTNITTDYLDANYAKVSDFNAAMAEIDTLIFGSAEGTTIQTSFANAVIAQLGNAQIKSAMIDSVSASKITSGDIITNNINVKSEDGKLLISDETIQISDGANVRVQIGKDSSGDYSINVWDQEGNLMFSEGGITDSAIKEAIIRNDMVANDANISASKLDIDSLFDEINGSEKTIKSTKVYFDDEKQTLDVVFTQMATDVDDLNDSVSSQGTAISAIQGQIESKIWKQDIDDATDAMSTQYSTLQQDLTGFKTTVGNTYSTNTTVNTLTTRVSNVEQTAEGLSVELENLTIGGRNLLRQSGQWTSLPQWWISSGGGISLDTSVKYLGHNTIKTTVGSGIVGNRGSYFEIDPNKTYTYSAMIMSDTTLSDTTNKAVPLHYHCSTDGSSNAAGVITIDYDQTLVAGEWKLIYLTFKPNGKYFRPYIYWGTSKSMTFNIAYLKLEEGNKPTAWTPAPEDVDNDILNAGKTATNYLNFSSSGLVVGDMTAGSLGKNVLIDSEAVKVRTGNTINAMFGADIIELAKYNASATISMLNGKFKIYYASDSDEKGYGVYGVTKAGVERLAFQPVNENDNLTIGWGGYNAKQNCTNIYGHNMNLVAGNDLAIECDDWKINIDGNLFAKASNNSFVELIGLSSDNNTAIGHGGYSAALGKTNIYGNKIHHIVNTSKGSASYKPYYEAGDSVSMAWYGAGFVSSSSSTIYFSIPLSKPIVGNPSVTISGNGLQVRQAGQYVYGSNSTTHVAATTYTAKVNGDGNYVQIEAKMNGTSNAVNNDVCGINAEITITFN